MTRNKIVANLVLLMILNRLLFVSIFIFQLLSAVSAISTVTLHETKYPKSFVKSHRDLLIPEGLAFGPEGELYFTDSSSHLIFKYEPGSEIEVFVGSSRGEKSMVGFRESAKLFNPSGIIYGKDGHLYVAAQLSHVIAKISLKGHVSVLAGKLDESGYRDGSCLDARFDHPRGVTESLDGSVIYVSEWWDDKGEGNNVIRSINILSCEVKTVAGSPDISGFKDGPGSKALFYGMGHIATHPVTGEIYICDSWNNAVRIFSPIYRTVSTLAGKGIRGYKDGRVSESMFDGPTGIGIDRKGIIYVADQWNHAIRTISPDGIVSTLAGGDVIGFYDGLRKDAQFRYPIGLSLDKDQMVLYASDGGNSAIRMVGTQSGNTGTVAVREGSGDDNGFGAFASFLTPSFLTADPSGNIYVSDSNNNEIRVILASSGEVKTFAGLRITGHDDGWKHKATFNRPEGIAFVGENLFICDSYNNAVRMINASGYVSTFAGSGKVGLRDGYGIDAELNNPIGITVDSSGTLFVTEYYGSVVRKITPDGYVSLYAGTGAYGSRDGPALTSKFGGPSGIVFNKQDDALYVADYWNHNIRRISSDGIVSTLAGNGNAGDKDGQGYNAQFNNPWQISLGPDGNFYLADSWNFAIRKITTDGIVSTVAGSRLNPGMRIGSLLQSRFRDVYGVFADPHSLSLIVADTGNNGIRNISLSRCKVESIAGYGSSVYINGQIGDKFVKNPSGIAFDPINSIIYYANTDRNVISSISMNGGQGASRYAGTGDTGWYDSLSSREAHFNGPQGLQFVFINGSYSFLLVADTGNDVIRKINPIDGSVTTVAGNGDNGFVILPPLKSSFNSPRDIVYDIKESCIYVADSGNNVIRRVRESAKETTMAIAGNRTAGYLDGVGAKSMFNQPSGLALLPDGSLLISDTYNHCIRMWNKTSRLVSTFAGTPGEDGFDEVRLNLPVGIVVSNSSVTVFVADSGNNAVRQISSDGSIKTLTLHDLKAPSAIAFDSDDNLLITDTKNNAVKRIILSASSSQVINLEAGLGVSAIIGITLGCIFALASSITVLIHIRKQRKSHLQPKSQVTDVLRMISMAPKRPQLMTVEITLTGSRTVQGNKSLFIPGYLELAIHSDIVMDRKGKDGGEGATAKVRRGKFASSRLTSKYGDIDLAVKFYKSDNKNDAFLYEVALMASLPNCANIIQLLGFSRVDHAIVMKYYAGNLDSLIKSSTFGLSTDKVFKIATDIANGMMHLHAAKIIHFDLKPLNVLIDDYSNLNCVICDFGFSHFVGDEYDLVSGLSKPLSVGITYAYAAPELLDIVLNYEKPKFSELEMKMDVYAFAITMYETISRTIPWKGLSKFDLYEKVDNGERPEIPESSRYTGDFKPIVELIRRCWAQAPNDRPEFQDVLSELSRLQ